MNETLLSRARHNHKIAKTLWQSMGDDELFLNTIGYHLQQSVELAIKYVIEMDGIEYAKTHDIEQLIRLANNHKINLELTEYICEHAEMFTLWEAKTRYILNYCLEKYKVERALKEVDIYLSILEKNLDPFTYAIKMMDN